MTAPGFSLPDPGRRVFEYSAIAQGRPLLVAFICNHCPFVVNIAGAFANFAREYQAVGLAVVAISSNDTDSHPEDSPPRMAEFARSHGFIFPYLYDETQEVALAFGAVCTPDFFLFDSGRKLAYHGQFDASRPRSGKVSDGADMRAAVDAMLAGRIPENQRASVGCSIKWKPGNTPDRG
jgi:peroxiredoxin